MKPMKRAIICALPLLSTTLVSSFQPTPFLPTVQTTQSSTFLSMAGFGGGAGSSSSPKGSKTKKGASAALKLKPKTQWDKYKSFKTASSINVAMRVANEGSDVGQWFDVGMIKSEGDEFTEVAVALQKGIITEHAKRLHPLQFLPKDRVEWGYASNTDSDDDWIVFAGKMAPPPPGVEKKIGFQGNADPSGYYASIGSRGYEGVGAKKAIQKPKN